MTIKAVRALGVCWTLFLLGIYGLIILVGM